MDYNGLMYSKAQDMKEQKIFSAAALETLCDDMAGQYSGNGDIVSAPSICLQSAQTLLTAAVSVFSQDAAQLLHAFFDEPERLILSHRKNMMCCHPAGSMDNEKALIEIYYDGSVKSAVILAHELGHVLADDIGRMAGRSILHNPLHMHEVQAYLLQHIMTEALQRHEHKGIAMNAKLAQAHAIQAMQAIFNASKVAEEALVADDLDHVIDAEKLMAVHFGDEWRDLMEDDQNMHRVFVMERVYHAMLALNDCTPNTSDPQAIQDLKKAYEAPFDRPAAYYAAQALHTKMKAAPQAKAEDILYDVMNASEARGLYDILKEAGLKDEGRLLVAASGIMPHTTPHMSAGQIATGEIKAGGFIAPR